MRYVALLRGINVGGANKVSMAQLKAVFEAAGMADVRTYINSGNVIFTTGSDDRAGIVLTLESAIAEATGLAVDVQLRDLGDLEALDAAMPAEWRNDKSMRCDVLFLQPDVDGPELLDHLGPRPGIEDALHIPGAIVWKVDRKNATRSRLTRIAGTTFYKRVTIRNCNTARKLLELLRG